MARSKRHVGKAADRSRPIKRRKPRGLGKGRIPTTTTRYVEPTISPSPTLSIVERAHAVATITRRLPLA